MLCHVVDVSLCVYVGGCVEYLGHTNICIYIYIYRYRYRYTRTCHVDKSVSRESSLTCKLETTSVVNGRRVLDGQGVHLGLPPERKRKQIYTKYCILVHFDVIYQGGGYLEVGVHDRVRPPPSAAGSNSTRTGS